MVATPRRGDTVSNEERIFVFASKIHLLVAEIYLSLSRRLAHDPDLRSLLALLAFEERSRAARIRWAVERCDQRDIMLPELSTARLRLLFAKLRVRQRTLAAMPVPSATGALELADSFDRELYAIRAETLFRYLDPVLDDELATRASVDFGQRALHARPHAARQRAKTRPFGVGGSAHEPAHRARRRPTRSLAVVI